MEPISYTDSSLNSPLNFDLQIRFEFQWQRTTVCWMVVMIFERAGQVKTLPLLLKGWNQSGPKVFRRVLQPSARSVCGNALTFWKQKIFLLWNVFVWRQCAQLHPHFLPKDPFSGAPVAPGGINGGIQLTNYGTSVHSTLWQPIDILSNLTGTVCQILALLAWHCQMGLLCF